MRHACLVLCGLLTAASVGCGGERAEEKQAPPAELSRPSAASSIIVEGFDTPESVLHDAVADLYLVSNIHGPMTEKDDNGYISRVAPDGTVAERRWIAGGQGGVVLHAPKGMAIVGDTLFVADIDTVRLFDRRNGAPVGAWAVPGASFLNDVAAGPDGTVYVTDTGVRVTEAGLEDTGSAGLFRFGGEGEAIRIDVPGDVARLNGITVDENGIHAVTFGSGAVFTLRDGARTDHATLPGKSLDGIVALQDGSMLISDWETQRIYRLRPDGTYAEVGEPIPSPADIGYDADRRRVLVPNFTGNEVVLLPLE